MLHFTISLSGLKKDVVARLRKDYKAVHDSVDRIANELADRVDRGVNDSTQPVSVHVSGHIEVHPKQN